ncbi:alginate lyase family protein [Sinorhizobium sp. BJ1]|uniref:alginate lyase family protein n=1 Tax=Sinorhizobium sp. BJ1 TaxID=2035455 RepID=UPI000BE80CD9|nr:alginate lyase family protein [Sinorhizobium sp. BJ1]PDT80353.1 hypothetical protein CO676_28135 [Sinorhizobium sp. BJ1]
MSVLPKAGVIACLLLSICVVNADAQASALAVPFELARHAERNNGKTRCAEAIPSPVKTLDLSSIYEEDDESHSTIDAKNKQRYDAAIAETRRFAAFVTKLASNYTQTDGNRIDAAACTLKALDAWAKANALSDLKSRQSYLSVTRIIAAAAIAYIQVQPAAEVLRMDTRAIDNWLIKLADRTVPVFTDSGDRTSNKQNHRYWGGFAVAAVGVATGRKEFLEFGFESYKLGACQVTAEGALPLELARRKKARDYHLHAVAPLVMIASLAQSNGYDAFSICNNGLQRLVHFALNAVNDPSEIEKLAGEKQVPLPRKKNGLVRSDRIAWLDAYLHYYPEDREKFGTFFDEPLFSASLGGRISALYNLSQRN